MITYHDFGFHGVITLWSGVFLSCLIVYQVYKAIKKKKQITLLDAFGILSTFVISFLPVVGVIVALVACICYGVKGIIFVFSKMDEIVIFDKNK